jgi:hypothetical protein
MSFNGLFIIEQYLSSSHHTHTLCPVSAHNQMAETDEYKVLIEQASKDVSDAPTRTR